MKVIYEIDYDFKATVKIEVDDDVCTQHALHEINQFWAGHERRVKAENGSVLDAVLKLIAQKALALELCGNYPLSRIADKFDWDDGNGVEGFPKLDGSMGLNLFQQMK